MVTSAVSPSGSAQSDRGVKPVQSWISRRWQSAQALGAPRLLALSPLAVTVGPRPIERSSLWSRPRTSSTGAATVTIEGGGEGGALAQAERTAKERRARTRIGQITMRWN